LNAFEADCGRGKEWFVDDERRLMEAGFDVDGMRDWWEKRCVELGGWK
jgi:hypothetical protein